MGYKTQRFQKALLLMLGAAVSVWVAWRLISQRRSLPCPPWLSWLLENPLTEGIRGQTIIGYLDLQPGMTVLDLGCGPGRLTLLAAEKVWPGGEVTAVDMQEEMLRRARQKIETSGLQNVRFLRATAGTGRLANGYFDRALLVTVLGEIPDQQTALQEVYQALKPGGKLAVGEVFPDPHFQSQANVRRLAQQVGFREDATYGNRLAYVMILSRQ